MGIFKNGLPTDIDINKIRAQYPDNNLKQGMKIAYEEISHLLGIDLASYRFRTVIARWRKKLENESGIFLKPLHGQKIWQVCDDADTADMSIEKTKSAARAAKRSVQIAAHVDIKHLNEDQRKRFETSQRFSAAVIGMSTVKAQCELPTI